MNVLKRIFGADLIIPTDTALADNRYLFVEGEINAEMASEFTKQVLYLALLDSDKPIKLIINSRGGEIEAGLKMCEVVKNSPCPINAYCFDKAYSMAAILFESVNANRYMVGHSKLMLHEPLVEGFHRGRASDLEELTSQLKEKNDLLLSIVANRCNISINQLKKETQKDRYFNEEEALKLGLADKIVTFLDLIQD